MSDATILLFSYGTLQQPGVQLATFGRHLDGEPDVLPGHVLGELTITDPHVLRTSGLATHPTVVATGDPADEVPGSVLAITPEELAASDEYEVDDYTRARVTLRSGREAWVYRDERAG